MIYLVNVMDGRTTICKPEGSYATKNRNFQKLEKLLGVLLIILKIMINVNNSKLTE